MELVKTTIIVDNGGLQNIGLVTAKHFLVVE